MSLNCIEIEKIVEEVDFSNYYIEEIYQTDFYSLVFVLYANSKKFFLNVCLLADKTRISYLYSKRKKTTPQRFCQFLRSTISSSKIISVKQIDYQRIILFKIKKSDKIYNLYIKLWTNSGNILLCDLQDNILDAFSIRMGRGEFKGKKFVIDKIDVQKEKYKLKEFDNDDFYGYNIESFYIKKQKEERLTSLRARLEKEYANRLKFLNQKIESIKKQKENRNSINYRMYGELIFSNIHTVKENFLEKITLKSHKGEEIEIPLDRTKTLKENANSFYQKAKKQDQKLRFALEEEVYCFQRLENTQTRYDYMKSLQDPQMLEEELKTFRDVSKKQNVGVKDTIYLEYFSNSFQILVGRDGASNTEILKRYVRGNDVWLHVRDYPGSYVFVKAKKNKTIPLDVLLDAGNIALFYSKAKSNNKADLHYTHVKYLRKAKNAKIGTVLPTQEKNLSIVLDNDRLSRLFGKSIS